MISSIHSSRAVKSTTKSKSQNVSFQGINNAKSSDLFTKTVSPSLVDEILSRSKEFGAKQYKKLTKAEKQLLRRELTDEISTEKVKTMIHKAELLEKSLEQKYPNQKFKIISLGQSLNPLVNIIKYKGKKTAQLHGSGMTFERSVKKFLNSDFIDDYKEHMENQGVDAKTISKKSNTLFIFIDYARTGKSLKNFETIFKDRKFGLELDNVEFKSINELWGFEKWSAEDKFFRGNKGKVFSSGFRMNELEELNRNLEKGQTADQKLAQFALIDELQNQNKL